MSTSVSTAMAGCLELEGDGYMDVTSACHTKAGGGFETPRGGQSSSLPDRHLKEEFGGTPIECQDDVKVLKTGKR
jgi:hypothetical protein